MGVVAALREPKTTDRKTVAERVRSQAARPSSHKDVNIHGLNLKLEPVSPSMGSHPWR